MINAKRLFAMAKKWQRVAAMGRKRISLSRSDAGLDLRAGYKAVADKGHFVIYSADSGRFVVPLSYLDSPVFRELFKMSEEEYGLPGNGPITFPCDAIFMEYVVSLLRRRASENVQKALLISVVSGRCSTSSMLPQRQTNQQSVLHVF